jgi:hypothetical protein
VVTGALGPADRIRTGQSVGLMFPLLRGQPRAQARLVLYLPGDAGGGDDIAGLAVTGGAPAGSRPARLVPADDVWQHTYRAFGLTSDRDSGWWTSGRLLDRDARGRIQVEGDIDRARQVAPGFSGTPLWDDQLGGVIGMVVSGIGG